MSTNPEETGPAQSVVAVTGMPVASSLTVSPRDLREPGRQRQVELSLRAQLERHARDSATHLVAASVRVRWRCEVNGVVFAYPAISGQTEDDILEQRRAFEAGAERAWDDARSGYGLVRWAGSWDGGRVVEP